MTIKAVVKGIVMICLVIVVFLLNEHVFNLRPSQLRLWISSFGFYAPLIFLIATIGRPFVLFPTSVLSIAGGLVFGPYVGTVLVVVGGSTGALLFFLAARKLGYNALPQALRRRGEKLEKGLSEQGFSYVLLLRLVPFLHFDLVSYVCGVSNVDKKKYYLATLVGMLPGALALNFLGASFLTNNIKSVVIAAIVLFVLLLITLYIRKKAFGSELDKEI
ncbi:TVP38/TMEM64 family protein [Guptibacillus algicola]|uniref:TVP38/TMEM64 family protein n=1 Tax=Guptibacillus algicola TaxID=225844 RepID=UPI001CD52E8E|nr:TVP38/TMEM64 family protein [Alkalihalobacillus algicola]MCA0985885.1 TVP38/TMEM64 family protein [Alkalihalobacillus algicola]